jgi:diaminohydroxyphosphoribosylaminopyrimidine deaminase/5-amino-6-(5-phosphoribosylamino)uracil reductase
MDDAHWMQLALAEAAQGAGHVEPNPMVGAAIVQNNALVALAHHARFGGPHAEAAALRTAGERARGGTLYVTLEPCCHHGKTPPCTDAILAAGIRRVVAAVQDPFPPVAGKGLQILRDHGVEVALGVCEQHARCLLAPFLKRVHTGLPFVTAKWAMTLDGKLATADRSSQWISSEASRGVVHQIRGRSDAILIGIGTALADDPLLTPRPPGPRSPIRIVLDPAARLPLSSRLVLSARESPVWLAATSRAPLDRLAPLQDAGVHVLSFASDSLIPIPELLAQLARQDVTNLLVEGGAATLGAFLDADALDAVHAFIAPLLEGGRHSLSPIQGLGRSLMNHALRLIHPQWSHHDQDAHLHALVPRPWLECVHQESPT